MTAINPAGPSDGQDNLETYVNKEGVKVVERFFDLPLDYANPNSGETIRIFARNLIPKKQAKTLEEEKKLPYFVYLQGGPGSEMPLYSARSDFVAEIHDRGYQTLFIDPRGTGLSTSLSHETLPARLKTDEEKANYFKYFRADSIVKDCEEVRKKLIGDRENPEDRKWSIIGQSFGGFCAITYLSFHAEGLKDVFITGGLAPLGDHPDPVYEATVHTVMKRNEIYYEKYPQDVARIRKIVDYLSNNDVKLPTGGRLSVTRWQAAGMDFGMQGGIDRVHQLVLRASNDLDLFGKFSYKTSALLDDTTFFDRNPIFAILHEPIYCQGRASDWAASRVVKNYPQFFSWQQVKLKNDEPLYFTGEMIMPEFFDDCVNLRPLKGAAEILAQDKSWGKLYDLEQLAKNEVKVSAVSYYDDMYVNFALAQETASKIRNTEQYITNQLVHSGLREDPKDVMKRLFQLASREKD